MLTTIFEIFLGIVGLSIIVMAHECGHYFAARLTGIRVQVFSLGFGKRIIGFRCGETDYQLSLIPLGGYCKFYGEESFRQALDQNLDSIPGEEGEFYGSPPWKRIIVVLCGPLASIVFSILILTVISWVGYQEHYTEPKIVLASEYSPSEELWPADLAGLQSGDLILEVDKVPIHRFQDLRRNLIFRPDEKIELTTLRNGLQQNLVITPTLDKENGHALIGVMNWVEPIVESVQPSSPAERAGFKTGDRIIRLNGQETPHTFSISSALQLTKDRPVETVVKRNGQELVLQWDIEENTDPGITFKVLTGQSTKLGSFASINQGISETWSIMLATLKGIRMMFMGIELQNAVSGPLRLISDTGATVAAGFRSGIGPGLLWSFELMALISVSLGFLNLLPIPVLDGGQTLLFLAEWFRRRPFRPRSIYRYQIIGTIIVFAIAIMDIAGDVIHLRNR